MKKSCKIVRKCLNGELCAKFNEYFAINNHQKNTRNRNVLLKLPKVKLEFGKKSFIFQGAKIYNELPLDIRGSDVNFNSLLSNHFN